MAFLDWIGIVRSLFGMLHADGDVLAAAAGFTHAMRPNGAVQRAGDDLRIGSGVVEHLLFDGLRALLQRMIHTRAELQIGRHVGQVVLQVIKALQFHRHGHFLLAAPPASKPRSTARCKCAWPGRRRADCIYGQNGSGKTAFIEALSILKSLLSGEQISFLYSDCIAAGSDHAELEFTFDLQYPTEHITVRKVVYSFCLAVYEAAELSKLESEVAEAFDGLFSKQVIRRKVRVYNEMLKIGGEIDGENKKVLPAIDTSTEAIAFGPSTKRKLFYEVNKENNVKLLVNKQLASERSTSFIFMSDTLELFTQQETHSTYLEVLLELNYFGRRYLAVVNTKSMAAIRSNVMLPLYTLNACDALVINTVGTNIISNAMLKELKAVVDPIGEVLPQFVPGMSISVEELGPAMLDDGREGKSVELVVRRGDRTYVGTTTVNIFGHSLTYPIMRTFCSVRLENPEKVTKLLGILEEGEDISIVFIPGEETGIGEYVDQLGESGNNT